MSLYCNLWLLSVEGETMRAGRSLSALRIFLVCSTLGIAACHVTLISEYDDVFDQEVTNTQKEVDALFQKIINNPDNARPGISLETYASNKDSYAKIHTELDALFVRASAHQHNEGSLDSVNKITHSFSLAEGGHKDRPSINIEAARGELMIMNQEFTALMREELLKKQTGDGGK
jgi:hypothetical protein